MFVKMAGYEVDVYLAEHFGALTDQDGRNFLQTSIESAVQTRALLEASYARTGDVAQSTAEITDMIIKKVPDTLLSREIFFMVTEQMFNYIAKRADNGP